ncbi:unnamed protein product [Amoebophrya sp. A120]|nr:unnamed protein product [Amoebophrya sp. A120]|eukprot:GSA120T00019419001.1
MYNNLLTESYQILSHFPMTARPQRRASTSEVAYESYPQRTSQICEKPHGVIVYAGRSFYFRHRWFFRVLHCY